MLLVFVLSVQTSYSSVWARNPDSKEATERFKKSTVYFVIPKYLLKDQEEEFLEAIQKGWTYNKIKVIDEKEVNKYIGEKYAAFLGVGYTLFNGSFSYLYFQLWQVNSEKIRGLGEKILF